MNRPPVFQQQPLKEEAKVSQPKEQSNQQNEIANASGNIVEVLKNSTNPKHRNSEFLKFLTKINIGALKIDGNDVVEDTAKMDEWQKLEV